MKDFLPSMKVLFGVDPACACITLASGTRLRLHGFNREQVAKSITKVVKNDKGKSPKREELSAPENFARFYAHLFLPEDVQAFVYLDADTIVQGDLREMVAKLMESGKTVGFVRRPRGQGGFLLMHTLKRPKDCKWSAKPRWSRLSLKTDYNVGVLAINLKRWKERHVQEKLEQLAAEHNRCPPGLFAGESQTQLLLAMYDHKYAEPEDYTLLDPSWNFGTLGWNKHLKANLLAKQKILHWNGSRKPWLKDGYYRPLWLLHRLHYDALLRHGETPRSSASSIASTIHDAVQRIRDLVQSHHVSP